MVQLGGSIYWGDSVLQTLALVTFCKKLSNSTVQLQISRFALELTGRGSSIGSVFAWHASGPDFDPHVRHILSWRLGHENISTAILPPPSSAESRRAVVSYWRKNVH